MKNTAGKRTLKERIISFMIGRNGPDALCNFSLYTAIALTLINILFQSIILSIVSYFTMYYALFRMLSRNVSKRQKENAKFLAIRKKVFSPFTLIKLRIRDRKTHVYRKCPYCKSVLRLPRRLGEHTAVCPKCRTRFDVTIK